MMIRFVAMFALFASAASAQAPAASPSPRTFVIDAKQSAFVIQAFKEGAAAAFAHDHTVHATEIAGTVMADPADASTAKVDVTIQTKTLVGDDPIVRKRFGLEPVVPEKDRVSMDHSMKSDEQLDAEKFPTIHFASTAVEKNGDKLLLVGHFTMHGVKKRIKMPIVVQIEGNTLTGDGKIRMLQSDWGIVPFSGFFGAIKVKDEIVLNVHLVAAAS